MSKKYKTLVIGFILLILEYVVYLFYLNVSDK